MKKKKTEIVQQNTEIGSLARASERRAFTKLLHYSPVDGVTYSKIVSKTLIIIKLNSNLDSTYIINLAL